MRLVSDWKKCWKWFSVQAGVIGSSMSIGYVSMYAQLKENFPPKYMMLVTAVVFALGVVGRVISQDKKD
jgi:formate/nitrite transporter FocA (FNT family)